MADNVPITPGTVSPATLATDEVTIGGILQQVQRIKLMDGSDGGVTSISGDAINGLDVEMTLPQGWANVTTTSVTIPASGSYTIPANSARQYFQVWCISAAQLHQGTPATCGININTGTTGSSTGMLMMQCGVWEFPIQGLWAGDITITNQSATIAAVVQVTEHTT